MNEIREVDRVRMVAMSYERVPSEQMLSAEVVRSARDSFFRRWLHRARARWPSALVFYSKFVTRTSCC